MKRLNPTGTKKTAKQNNAQILRERTRNQLLQLITTTIVRIEKEFCRQDECDFRYPDEEYNISLDADCVSASDFVYQIEVTDCLTGITNIEDRTLGKITLDGSGLVCLSPRGDRESYEELEASEMDTDNLFRLCDFLESSLVIIKKDSK